MQDVHWDAPIYLRHGKEFAETPYLRNYVQHAAQIAEELPRFRLNEDKGTPYWGFMRIGNTRLIGAVTTALGANTLSLNVTFWLYTLLPAAAAVLAVLLSIAIIDSLAERSPVAFILGR